MKNSVSILAIRNLALTNYRNHLDLSLSFENTPVVIIGNNGVGKTNILEAISLLSPGKGIRGNSLDQITNHHSKTKQWRVNSIIDSVHGKLELSSFYSHEKSKKREILINDQRVKNQGELAEIFSIIWLTPLMDQIFIGPKTPRRKFIDKLVYNFDEHHAARVNKYEKLVAERLKILKSNISNNIWLNSVEKQISEIGVAIAVARTDIINYMQNMIDCSDGSFPKAIIKIKGEIEEMVAHKTSLQIEEQYAHDLRESRRKDFLSERTNIGVHRSDLEVYHHEKNTNAKDCSTGEQKALLLTIILAQAASRIKWKSSTPVILLDEVIAHLDQKRRHELFEKLLSMKIQFWLTGTDKETFSELGNKVQFLNI